MAKLHIDGHTTHSLTLLLLRLNNVQRTEYQVPIRLTFPRRRGEVFNLDVPPVNLP